MPRCSSCKEELPLDAFYRRASHRQSQCKTCHRKRRQSPEWRAYHAEYRRTHAAERAAYQHEYYLAHIEEKRAQSKEWYTKNRAAKLAKAAAWQKAHREKCAQYEHAYDATPRGKAKRKERDAQPKHQLRRRLHNRTPEAKAMRDAYRKTERGQIKAREAAARRRARKLSCPIEPVDFDAIRKRDNMRCHICGRRVSEGELEFDHLVPVLLGGPFAQWNLRVSHRSCNRRRGAGLLPAQFPLIP